MSYQCVKVCLETFIYFHMCLLILENLHIRSCAFIYINISNIRKMMFDKRNHSCYKRSLRVSRTTPKKALLDLTSVRKTSHFINLTKAQSHAYVHRHITVTPRTTKEGSWWKTRNQSTKTAIRKRIRE